MFSWLFLDFLTFCFRFYEKCEEIDWERNAKFAAIGTIWVGSRSKMFKLLQGTSKTLNAKNFEHLLKTLNDV